MKSRWDRTGDVGNTELISTFLRCLHLHTHSIFPLTEGSLVVLKSKVGGPLTSDGCLEMHARPAATDWGRRPARCLVILF